MLPKEWIEYEISVVAKLIAHGKATEQTRGRWMDNLEIELQALNELLAIEDDVDHPLFEE